jgi:DNA-3-methyladenine glycosylase II
MRSLRSEGDLALAVERLMAAEPRFVPVVARHGLPPLRLCEPGLKSLLRIVTDQLISLKAGEAIWSRLEPALDPFTPEAVLAWPQTELRALGLSGAKARTFHAAARAAGDGLLTGDEAVLPRLLQVTGIGPWTANVYLLSALGFADAWPAADLALQSAAMDLLSLPVRPGARDMAVLGEGWRPYRSAACLLLWSHYRAMKGMPQA